MKKNRKKSLLVLEIDGVVFFQKVVKMLLIMMLEKRKEGNK